VVEKERKESDGPRGKGRSAASGRYESDGASGLLTESYDEAE